MKKQIAIAIGLAVLSTSALASKARLEALGQDANGSLYLEDSRSIFLNPAHLNHHKDFVTLEFGDTDATIDTASSPRAEGGVFKSQGNIAYGIYFGSESNTGNALRAEAMGVTVVNPGPPPVVTSNSISERNNIDFFIAGDAGVQWGARLTYGRFKNDQGNNDQESSTTRLALGAISGDLEGYLNIGIGNEAKNGANEFDGKTSFAIGGIYNRSGYDFMLEISSLNAEDGNGDEFSARNFAVGVARKHKLNDRATMWASIFYRNETMNNDFTGLMDDGLTPGVAGIADGETKSNYLPIILGMEIQVKDWLTLRGSVTHELFGTDEDDDGDKRTRDTTIVAAGASLTWGDLSLDGMIGNTDGGETTGSNTANGNGGLRTDQLLSRVSLNYKF